MKKRNYHITPEWVDKLTRCEIFVFGSNLQGQHHGGAARMAYEKFGAEWGAGNGRTGRCYAIPTMHGGLEDIRPYVEQFIDYAAAHPDNRFLLTRIGCGIAGFTDKEMAPLFERCLDLPNVSIPKEWIPYISIGRQIDAGAGGLIEKGRDEAPETITEEVLRELCREYRYEIATGITKNAPSITIRYVIGRDRFGYARFGDFFFAGDDLYVWHTEDEWADDHNQDIVEDVFEDECEGRGYAVRSIFAGAKTKHKDSQGQCIFTGDVLEVVEQPQYALGPLAVAAAGAGNDGFYGFPLDNHCLRLDDGMKSNHLLTRIGTVFCQLDWNNEPESIWELALRFNAPQTPGDDKGLKRLMAKFTPNFDQEPWKYQALELIGAKFNWDNYGQKPR